MENRQKEVSGKGAKPLIGTLLLLVYIVLGGLPIWGLLRPIPANLSPELTAQLRNMRILWKCSIIPYLLTFFPLLILGVRSLTGPSHNFWRWQKARCKRNPIISYIFLFLGAMLVLDIFKSLSVPASSGGNIGVTLVIALVFFVFSLKFYIGKDKDKIAADKSCAEASRILDDGLKAERKGNYEQALAFYNEVLKLYPAASVAEDAQSCIDALEKQKNPQ